MKVLIIEDHQMLVDLYTKVCMKELSSPEIKAATTVAAARAILEEGFVPDLVISDGELPDGHGPSVFPLIREKNPGAFILLSSSLPESAFPNHLATIYRIKPVMPHQLTKMLLDEEKRLGQK